MKAIVRLDSSILVTLVNNSQVVCSEQLEVSPNCVNRIFALLSPYNLRELTFLVKCHPVSKKNANVSYVFKNSVNDKVRFGIWAEDLKQIKNLGRVLGLDVIKIVNQIEIYRSLYKDDKVILVDEFIDGDLSLVTLDNGDISEFAIAKPPMLSQVLTKIHNKNKEVKISKFKDGLDFVGCSTISNSERLSEMERVLLSDSLIALNSVSGEAIDLEDSEQGALKDPVFSESAVEDTAPVLKDLSERVGRGTRPASKSAPNVVTAPKGKIINRRENSTRNREIDVSDSEISTIDQETIEVVTEKKEKRKKLSFRKNREVLAEDQSAEEDLDLSVESKQEVVTKLEENLEVENSRPINSTGLKRSAKLNVAIEEEYVDEKDAANRKGLVTLIVTVFFIIIGISVAVSKISVPAFSDSTMKIPEAYISELTANIANISKEYPSGEGYYQGTLSLLLNTQTKTSVESANFRVGTVTLTTVSPSRDDLDKFVEIVKQSFSVISIEDLPKALDSTENSVRMQIILK